MRDRFTEYLITDCQYDPSFWTHRDTEREAIAEARRKAERIGWPVHVYGICPQRGEVYLGSA